MKQYAYQILGIVGTVVTLGGGALAYRWRSRTDLEAKKEAAQIDAQAVPIQILRDELAKREQELTVIRNQDRLEREQYIKTLGSMEVAINEIATEFKANREEQRQRAHQLNERLDVTDDRLLVIETRLGVEQKKA